MRLLKYFTFTIALAIVDSYSDYSTFLKLTLDLQEEFLLRMSLFVLDTKNANDDSSSLIPLKSYSNNNRYSNVIDFNNLPNAIDYYYRMTKPFLIIFINSSKDFTRLVQVMQYCKMRIFWSLVIFTKKSDDSIMNICSNPKKNYFNLYYNAHVLILCAKNNVTVINEWYSINPDEVEVATLGTWSEEKGFVFSAPENIFERRRSMKGKTLRVTDLNKDTMNLESTTAVGGLFKNVLEIIALKLNFTVSYQKLENFYGVYNATANHWNGLVGRAARNETDVAIGEIAETSERWPVVDFSLPILSCFLKFYVKKINNAREQQWSMYYKPFSLYAGISTICILIIGALVITFITLCKNKCNGADASYVKNNKNFWRTIEECYLDTWAIFCSMQLIDTATTSSLQIAHTALYILSFIIYAMYAGVLMSHSTIFKFKLIFNSLQDFMNDGSYRITVVKDTTYMKRLYDDSSNLSKKLKYFVLDYNDLKSSIGDALKQICSDKKVIFLMDEWGVRSNIPSNCELASFDQDYLVNMAFAFMKDSPYSGLFNYYIYKLRDLGILQALRKRYEIQSEPFYSNYESVTFTTTLPIFFILVIGIGVSVLILIFEKIHFRLRATYNIRNHEFSKSKRNYWKALIRPEHQVF